MRNKRNLSIAAGFLGLVGVITVIALQVALNQSPRVIWVTTKAIVAGDLLSADNVAQTTVVMRNAPAGLELLSSNPLTHRASHSMSSSEMLRADDILPDSNVQVALRLTNAPPLSPGNVIDIYVLVGRNTERVGANLQVASVNGDSIAVWVPSSQEPAWISLAANNALLSAALSHGVGVPNSPVTIDDSVQQLTGQAANGSIATAQTGAQGVPGPSTHQPAPPSARPTP